MARDGDLKEEEEEEEGGERERERKEGKVGEPVGED